MNLKTPVSELAGVGEGYATKLKKLGIINCEDLLWYLPKRWNDFSNTIAIGQAKPGELISLRGKICQINNKPTRSRIIMTEAIITDETGTIKAIWFNQPFLTKTLSIGNEVCLAGKIEYNGSSVQMISPEYEKITEGESELIHTGRIVPVYGETEGVSSKWLRVRIKPLIKLIYSIKDYLPEDIKEKNKLLDLPAAIRQVHFPENRLQLEKALRRLNFDEMFLLQLTVCNARKKLNQERSLAIPFNESLVKGIVSELPFNLTNAQRKSIWEALQDMAKPTPMNRLLEGDVGSGKTIVAAILMCNTAITGAQAVLLCPTEILARQHFNKITELIEKLDLEVALLTGSTKKDEKNLTLTRVKDGEIKIIVGTHALLEKGVEFWRLGLAIVDEQHRFGVDQRAALRKESISTNTLPHFLSMTATPIPRTLSLTIYGDLDVSVIDETPVGRKKALTKIVTPKNRPEVYKFMAGEIRKGCQAFVICPLVGEDNDLDTEKKTVMKEFDNLSKNIFPKDKIGYIHGRLKSEDKELAMKNFIDGKTDILVSTSVVEVGVDIPNATMILIEGAERFGLSQLHQFRGRVMRGDKQSYCFVSTDSDNEKVINRLSALVETDNGFNLAEADLAFRGPGDYLGKHQHGLANLRMRNLMDLTLIKETREAAKKFLADYNLENRPLLLEKTKPFSDILYLE